MVCRYPACSKISVLPSVLMSIPGSRELGDLLDVLVVGVVAEHVELAGPVGAEEQLLADPVRVGVVAPALRLPDLGHLVRLDVVDPDARVGAAAVVLPLGGGVADRGVGDVVAVRRVRGLEAPRDRQLGRHPAGEGHGEELAVPAAVHVPRGREQHALAVRGEPATTSGDGWLVSRVGAPPVTGMVYTSVLPSYWALNAMVVPSGPNTGFDSTPRSVVSRRGFAPLASATHRSSA
jgi:hypothetical protein